ncbi:hypothetical protein ILUMI_21274 [Ignelater luminosus]|uniref:Transposable element P transposase-like RNase H domain-containing protein n=1 Tax=Ignelater luminosus TaxID=2038154 RepID=A0A8K0CCS3_IGNLU|nr:hypothetical protein ILUMI_21274 [Ignelater luminosus]
MADTLIWACALQTTFPGAYIRLRNSDVLTLPHPQYIRKLMNKLSLENTNMKNDHLAYIKNKTACLDEKELIVNLLIDEICINSKITNKGGKMEGSRCNDNKEAVITMQVFMITSILSNNKDVVGLYPVKNLESDQLLELTLNIIKVLTGSGYNIITIISGNNQINRRMFELLCEGQLQTSIKNPYNLENRIFLLFDSVHLFKCIRNNWINQIDNKQTFVFPQVNFCNLGKSNQVSNESEHIKVCACISDLKELYNSEKNKLVKLAPALSFKVLYPSCIERQNVNLCVKLFDEKNITALKLSNGPHGTIQFLELISCWWKIMNCRTLYGGIHKRDEYMKPIINIQDEKLDFFKNFLKWLNKWDQLGIKDESQSETKERHGKLSQETHFALTHSIKAVLDLCHYLFNVLKFGYILLGKFQTDGLEARFG